ncbi:MAG: UvrD-helicase domain-containing protein [Burkholderiales bacterium]|nr:UvrD-helicase domain-containing protein [Burkholderiales bacterium]
MMDVEMKSQMAPADLIRAYEADGLIIDAAQFTARACDPARSVVVEACAGSGKTWLLVARMLRLLLEGAQPAELLAITFTRKAAQEMRERLMALLEEFALADDSHAAQLLTERGVSAAQLPHYLPRARGLYERLLGSTQALSIDTFHSWFGRLLQLAPLSSGVPHGFQLLESVASLQHEAWNLLMQGVQDDASKEVAILHPALMLLYQTLGDASTHDLLNAFLDKRAEWWACTLKEGHGHDADKPLEQLRALMGDDAEHDARQMVWQDGRLLARIQKIALTLGQGSPDNQKRGVAIETVLTTVAQKQQQGEDIEQAHFASLAWEFFGADGTNRKNRKTKALAVAITKHWGEDQETDFHEECDAIAEELKRLVKRSKEAHVLEVNRALFVVGQAYLECYQHLKAGQRSLDFADLEWQVYRLLSDENYAAYLHGRLDARYKHILLDEFQDTNPLQWHIVRAWLDAYGGDESRPSVFVVGDPKQSIYRFRRADPRVFNAAREMLAAQGASVLRTNQTRRNSPEVVQQLNTSMLGNPIFVAQTTAAASKGEVWRLPLLWTNGVEDETQIHALVRDPFVTPAIEQDDLRRYQEGQLVAQALLQWRSPAESDCAWSDVMLLVRRRTHLSAYEKALREAGIPFVSNRRGGLLQTLEVADLIALLQFLMTPGDDKALAHILKSPMFGASDAHLMRLAQMPQAAWWKRLQVIALENDHSVLPLSRACNLLQQWMCDAHDLPVHDLLDRIVHQGELLSRYASTSNLSQRNQVLGNLRAFTELALNMDGGRYPSLPKFIAALNEFDRFSESDSPDESQVLSGQDAVQILTIHSAKGLEAKVVVILDANHSEAAKDNAGVLCAWPLKAGEEKHFSVFGKKDDRGLARDTLFLAEEEQAKQENWNLLYVALTRAKQVLMVSGIASDKSSGVEEGVSDGSWYQCFLNVEESEIVAQKNTAISDDAAAFSLALFNPASLRLEQPPSVSATDEQIEGIALHTLMERISQDVKSWPIKLPSVEVISAWLPCNSSVAAIIRTQAQAILSQAELEKFFNPSRYQFARNEMAIVFQGHLLRLDRLVSLVDALWILDYKRQLLESEVDDYRAQLLNYCAAVSAIYPGRQVKAGLILSDGTWVEMV